MFVRVVSKNADSKEIVDFMNKYSHSNNEAEK
jgi:hypothetical protein